MRRLVAMVVLAAFLVACGPPVTVRRVKPRDVYRRDSASILDEEERTRFADIELHRTAVSTAENERQMLIDMHHQAVEEWDQDAALALAELAYLRGERTDNRDDYLGAAVYAYAYLFGVKRGSEPTAWDPRTRIAADIYNRSLSRAFASPDGERFLPEPGTRRLPIGRLQVTVPRQTIEWEHDVEFDTFFSADIYEVEGLAARYRRAGLGAPLIGQRAVHEDDGGLYPNDLNMAATAFLRVLSDREQLRRGILRASLELYDPFETPTIEVAGQQVPLEAQPSTAYAHLLGESSVWEFELAGFLSGQDETIRPGIRMLERYRPDAIPVVFVHGTASSPGRWASLFNDLSNDPRIEGSFQGWFFAYNSGNPVAYSAALLRQAIRDTLQIVDPDGDDVASRDMVLIGHSQGGLLVRLAISDTTEFDWARHGTRDIEAADLDDDARALLEEVLIFEPTRPVSRAVFMATPHRGSYVAGGRLGQIGAGLVTVSRTVMEVPLDAIRWSQTLFTGDSDDLSDVPTAVDNMVPGSRFNRILAQIPMSPDVPRHSIIAVQTDGPVEEGNDGVVEYESAHLEEVESELVVKSGHSLQSNPHTVREVKRILVEHLAASNEPSNDREEVP